MFFSFRKVKWYEDIQFIQVKAESHNMELGNEIYSYYFKKVTSIEYMSKNAFYNNR